MREAGHKTVSRSLKSCFLNICKVSACKGPRHIVLIRWSGFFPKYKVYGLHKYIWNGFVYKTLKHLQMHCPVPHSSVWHRLILGNKCLKTNQQITLLCKNSLEGGFAFISVGVELGTRGNNTPYYLRLFILRISPDQLGFWSLKVTAIIFPWVILHYVSKKLRTNIVCWVCPGLCQIHLPSWTWLSFFEAYCKSGHTVLSRFFWWARINLSQTERYNDCTQLAHHLCLTGSVIVRDSRSPVNIAYLLPGLPMCWW